MGCVLTEDTVDTAAPHAAPGLIRAILSEDPSDPETHERASTAGAHARPSHIDKALETIETNLRSAERE
jgi:hypothetical protein